jgi:predicted phosphohydrolase
MNKTDAMQAADWQRELERLRLSIARAEEERATHIAACKHWSTRNESDPPTGKSEVVCEWCGRAIG